MYRPKTDPSFKAFTTSLWFDARMPGGHGCLKAVRLLRLLGEQKSLLLNAGSPARRNGQPKEKSCWIPDTTLGNDGSWHIADTPQPDCYQRATDWPSHRRKHTYAEGLTLSSQLCVSFHRRSAAAESCASWLVSLVAQS